MAEAGGHLSARIRIQDVIREERKFLGLDTIGNPDVYTAASGPDGPSTGRSQAGDSGTTDPRSSDHPWALCLSGGGIRSATFGLGVLQGLAEVGALRRFHYLSTVSGGGYIGSWLSRWIHEEKGDIDRVQEALDGNASGKHPSGEPRQLRSLRAYSNYLSPVWGLSTDFFTLVSIFFRNLLLNWLVLLPLLFLVVLLPRLYVAVTVGVVPTEGWEWTLIAVAGVLIATGLAYVVADLPFERCPRPVPRDRFGLLCFLPIATAAALLGIVIGWNGVVVGGLDAHHYILAGVGVHIIGCVAGMVWRAKRNIPGRTQSTRSDVLAIVVDFVLVAVSGAAGGWLVYALAKWGPEDDALHATIAAPLLLFAFWLATTLYVALVKYWSSEGDREWWARSGAWWVRFALCWVLGFGLVIFVPEWIGNTFAGSMQYAAAAGGLWGIMVAAIGYWTKNGAKIADRAQTLAGTIGLRLLDIAAIIFLLGVLIACCFAIDFAVAARLPGMEERWGTAYALRMQSEIVAWPLALFAGLLALAGLAAFVVGINTFSLHSMYGNRLVRAYFGAARNRGTREPHWFTGLDFGDNVTMAELQSGWISDTRAAQEGASGTREHRLLHVINIALNLVSTTGGRLEWQQRKAASFTVSKLHSGSDVEEVGFLPSAQYSNISLGRAMTISGAAASSNMGYHSSPPVALVMTLFNVRLGWWLPNPGYSGKRAAFANAASEPRWALRPLLWEALSAINETRPYLYLSDGGHFDNLGLYEMVRRGCRRILVVDVTADPENAYKDLQDVIRKIRVDFGICVEFDAGAMDKPRRCVIGHIGYLDGGNRGILYYVKPMLCHDEPLDVQHYARQTRERNPKSPFPHQSTSDQFFDEAQFESYRVLGRHTIMELWPRGNAGDCGWPTKDTLAEYEKKVAACAPPPQPEKPPSRFGRRK